MSWAWVLVDAVAQRRKVAQELFAHRIKALQHTRFSFGLYVTMLRSVSVSPSITLIILEIAWYPRWSSITLMASSFSETPDT